MVSKFNTSSAVSLFISIPSLAVPKLSTLPFELEAVPPTIFLSTVPAKSVTLLLFASFKAPPPPTPPTWKPLCNTTVLLFAFVNASPPITIPATLAFSPSTTVLL